MTYVRCRPVNASGNSWADRVRGVQHGGSTLIVPVNHVCEVTEDVTESTGPISNVQTQQPQQQSAITAPGKLLLTVINGKGKGKGQVLAIALLTRELMTRRPLQFRKWQLIGMS